MSLKAQIGKIGETMVADFLRSKGYIIIAENYHSRFGEIDIIAENREYILFIEVKTRHKGSMVSAADAVNKSKQKKLVLTAYDFLSKIRMKIKYRFDVAEVYYEINELGELKADLNYIKNAFSSEVLEGEPF